MMQSSIWRRFILPGFVVFLAGIAWLMIDQTTGPVSDRDLRTELARCADEIIGSTVEIPGGTLLMGSTQYYPEERPIISVEIQPFNIDAHEVTNAQFAKFVSATGYVTSAESVTELGFAENGSAVFNATKWAFVAGAQWRHPEGPNSDIEDKANDPVVHISLSDAEAYAAWIGRRLPTEAEYEFAARGGLLGKEYAWGDALTPGGEFKANHWQGVFPFADTGDDGHQGRAPIGCFEPNGYGVYDLIGNVWEWTSDPYYPDRRWLDENGQDPSPDGFDSRQPDVPVGVIKGGSFLCAQNFCRRFRPAARHAQDTGLGTNHIGFRTVSSEADSK